MPWINSHLSGLTIFLAFVIALLVIGLVFYAVRTKRYVKAALKMLGISFSLETGEPEKADSLLKPNKEN